MNDGYVCHYQNLNFSQHDGNEPAVPVASKLFKKGETHHMILVGNITGYSIAKLNSQ